MAILCGRYNMANYYLILKLMGWKLAKIMLLKGFYGERVL